MEKIIITNITGIGDPFIIYENDTYYMYATTGGEEFSVYTSKDSKTFSNAGVCLSKNNTFASNSLWAPEVIKYQNKYYLLYSGRSLKDNLMHIQIAVSDSPLGPFVDISEEPLINMKDKSTIDAHCFIDEDDKKYLFFSLDCSTNIVNGVHTSQIYCIRLSDDFKSTIGEYIFISTPTSEFEKHSGPEWQWNEGPFVLKYNQKYYLTYSTNFYASKEYCVGCLVSSNITGPYKKMKEAPILSYIENVISGPGHNAFFVDKDCTLKCVYHVHTDYEHPSGDRKACISLAYFDENDNLIIDYK